MKFVLLVAVVLLHSSAGKWAVPHDKYPFPPVKLISQREYKVGQNGSFGCFFTDVMNNSSSWSVRWSVNIFIGRKRNFTNILHLSMNDSQHNFQDAHFLKDRFHMNLANTKARIRGVNIAEDSHTVVLDVDSVVSIFNMKPVDDREYRCELLEDGVTKQFKIFKINIGGTPKVTIGNYKIRNKSKQGNGSRVHQFAHPRVETCTATRAYPLPKSIQLVSKLTGRWLDSKTKLQLNRNKHGTFNVRKTFVFTPTINEIGESFFLPGGDEILEI